MTKLVQSFTAKIQLWIIFRKLVYGKQTILLQLFPPFRLLQNDYFYQNFEQNDIKNLFLIKKTKIKVIQSCTILVKLWITVKKYCKKSILGFGNFFTHHTSS